MNLDLLISKLLICIMLVGGGWECKHLNSTSYSVYLSDAAFVKAQRQFCTGNTEGRILIANPKGTHVSIFRCGGIRP